MNLSEFKAWLEGYSAAFENGVPSADQWAEVQKRIKAARPDAPPPYPAPIRPYYQPPPLWQCPNIT